MMDLQQRLNMNHACESVIRLDQQIKFVCVIDENAKLLVGQSRPIPTNLKTLNTNETNETHSNKSKIDDLVEIYFNYRNSWLFYSDYLLWVIRSCTSHLDDTKNNDNSCITHIPNKIETSNFFELSGLDSDNVKLVVTPLNITMRTFLCIYFDPSYSIKSSVAEANKRFKILLRKINIIASLHSKMLDLL